MRQWFLGCGALVLSLIGATQVDAAVLYSQPSNDFGFFFSQSDTGGPAPVATTYDNFTLAANATVTNVAWTAGWIFGVDPSSFPLASFTLTFYNDNAGAPGSVLSSQTIPGNSNQSNGRLDTLTDTIFDFNTNLPTPVALTGGTQYWLSIVGNLASPVAIFGWENSNVGDGVQYISFGTDPPAQLPLSDSAFTLSDSSGVPEPSMLVISSVLMGLFGVGRSRKRLTQPA